MTVRPRWDDSTNDGYRFNHDPTSNNRGSATSDQTIWTIALGVIVLDLLLFMVPIVPFLVAYVLLARPPWFKDFVDSLYDTR